MEMSSQEIGHYEGQLTSASSSSDNVFGYGNVFEEALRAGHYEGQRTSTSASSSLANVFGNVNVSEEALKWAMAIFPRTYCLWWGTDTLLPCCSLISHDEVPDHFKTVHGIKNKGRKEKILCRWDNCGEMIGRHNFVRHIREIHLGSKRS